MKRLLYGVTTAQGAGATSATNALSVRNSAGTSLLVIGDDGAVRVGTNASATTQTTASINASGSGTNIGLALVPKGSGAITAQIPDGTATGGNARGANAVDLQLARLAATQVASGDNSFVVGSRSTASGPQSIAMGTSNSTGTASIAIGGHPVFGVNTASGTGAAAVGGVGNTASGAYAFTTGDANRAEKHGSIAMGLRSVSYLLSQRAVASGVLTATSGDAQTSDIRLFRLITGTATTELTLDSGTPAAGTRAILNLLTGATSGRVWNAKIQLIAVCTVQGAGTVTAGEVYGGNYSAIIKRIGNSTSIVGAGVISAGESYDTNMETSVVTISADDTNESLKIEFTPPTTAAADTVIRVVATVYLTEVGY